MKRELRLAILVAAILMTAFILTVAVTEKSNMNSIREYYSTQQLQKTADSNISLPAPSKDAYEFEANKVTVWIISILWGMAVPAFFLFSGLSARLRKWIDSKTSSFIISAALFFLIYSVYSFLLNLPLDFYSGFIRLHSFGLSNQTFAKWVSDSLISAGISTLIGTIIVWVPYLVIRKSPKRWWLYIGLLSIPAMTFMMYISPLYIDPLFNKYIPLKNKTLETEIYQLLDKTTIGNCQIYGIEKSVDTKQMNAYMTGMFGSKRIVLWDTTMNNLDDKEVLTIVAHEMGHYALGHIWKGILLGGLLTIIGLFIVNKVSLWIIAKSGGTFGFTKLGDIASLPLLFLVFNLVMFAANPIINGVSRYQEHQADTYALELTKDNYSFSSSMIKLHQTSLSLPNPGPVYEFWVYDHPTLKERVDFAASYKPWEKNKPLEFREYIK
ncbi:MAG: M48 family metallopeptidase [Bacillota bacterium]|nr:M48 family metallopeptidase [Bacillota bacterium]